jgi:molybdate transport system substrate-binding protein
MVRFLGTLLVGALCFSGCVSSTSSSTDSSSISCPEPKNQGTVVVLAASSMANVLQEIKPEYLADHPCVTDLVFSFGSSATLAAQIVNGSPADVFVSASKSTMDTVTSAGVISTPSRFAKNYAAIMIYKDSKFDKNITSLLSLLDSKNPDIKVGLCVETAPCGSLADSVLQNAGEAYGNQSLNRDEVADTESPSVEDLVSKIEMGELDAGIVYKSDCRFSATSKKSSGCVEIPDMHNGKALNLANEYYVGAINAKANSREFSQFVVSSAFQSIIQSKHGFSAP